MLTRKQQALYRPLVEKAWKVQCSTSGGGREWDREEWYREQLIKACGIYTTKQASSTKDFDALMAHFANLAGDEYWIRRSAEGDEIRLRHLVKKEIDRGAISEAYISGICRKMKLAQDLADMPANHLWKLWNALRRHNIRQATMPF